MRSAESAGRRAGPGATAPGRRRGLRTLKLQNASQTSRSPDTAAWGIVLVSPGGGPRGEESVAMTAA